MPEQWMVRVEGKEYGPVDEDDLREWRDEGRLIRQNEVRRMGEENWSRAGDLPEIFADDAPEQPSEPPDLIVRRRTGPEILRETIRIYRNGFSRFLLFGLLTAVPMFVLQWHFPKVPLPRLAAGSTATGPAVAIPPICWLMLLLVILLWPVSTAAFQFVADDILRGRERSIAEQFAAALQRWGRMLRYRPGRLCQLLFLGVRVVHRHGRVAQRRYSGGESDALSARGRLHGLHDRAAFH